MADEMKQEARMLAGHLTTCPTVAHLSTPVMGEEFAPILEEALRAADRAGWDRAIEAAAQTASAWGTGILAQKILDLPYQPPAPEEGK